MSDNKQVQTYSPIRGMFKVIVDNGKYVTDGEYVKYEDYKQLQQQLAEAKAENEHLRKACETLTENYTQLESQYVMGDYLREHALSLAEERRVALAKCDPYNDESRCNFCNAAADYYTDQHGDSCDYTRLCKEDA